MVKPQEFAESAAIRVTKVLICCISIDNGLQECCHPRVLLPPMVFAWRETNIRLVRKRILPGAKIYFAKAKKEYAKAKLFFAKANSPNSFFD